MPKVSTYLTALVMLVAAFCAMPNRGSAASYDVSASIPFPVPTQAATIDSSFVESTKESDTLEIFGTCQSLAPTSIVSIIRNGLNVGSVNCEPNGTFRLTITLNTGANSLIARTSNISSTYGPDSTPVVVYFVIPQTGNTDETPGTEVEPPSDLTVTSLEPFELLDEGNTGVIEITVSGGRGPYTLAINWGDGSTETLLIADPGTFTFKHTYSSKGIFRVVATVTDILGASKVYQFLITSASLPSSNLDEQPTSAVGEKNEEGVNFWLIIASIFTGILLLLLLIFSSFWLGRRYQYRLLKGRLKKLDNITQKARVVIPLSGVKKRRSSRDDTDKTDTQGPLS